MKNVQNIRNSKIVLRATLTGLIGVVDFGTKKVWNAKNRVEEQFFKSKRHIFFLSFSKLIKRKRHLKLQSRNMTF